MLPKKKDKVRTGLMMEELELDASAFWRHFDGECRAAYRGNGTSAYERTTLLMLFLWADQPATITARAQRRASRHSSMSSLMASSTARSSNKSNGKASPL